MVSKIVGNITPSATCELEGLIGSMRKEGVDVVALNIGEPDYKTPENICGTCKEALDQRKTTYVATAGIAELRQAICRKLLRDNGLTYAPEQICVSTGAKQALFNAVMAVTNPGDQVIIPTPGWVSYVEMVKLVGKAVEIAPSEELFANPLHPYTQALLAAIPEPDLSKRDIPFKTIKGEVSSPINVKPGCRFCKRCEYAMDRCDGEDKPLIEVSKGHFVACELHK